MSETVNNVVSTIVNRDLENAIDSNTNKEELDAAIASFGIETLESKTLKLTLTPSYADDTAAGVGGLTIGQVYQTSGAGAAPLNAAGILMIKQ